MQATIPSQTEWGGPRQHRRALDRSHPLVAQRLRVGEPRAGVAQPREATAVHLAGGEGRVLDDDDLLAALEKSDRGLVDADVGLEADEDGGRPGDGARIAGVPARPNVGLISAGETARRGSVVPLSSGSSSVTTTGTSRRAASSTSQAARSSACAAAARSASGSSGG